jgi:hypothetical protein
MIFLSRLQPNRSNGIMLYNQFVHVVGGVTELHSTARLGSDSSPRRHMGCVALFPMWLWSHMVLGQCELALLTWPVECFFIDSSGAKGLEE